jgi:hypothetical protein
MSWFLHGAWEAHVEDKIYTEGDWKLFRKRIADWQEAYMERLVREYIDVLGSDELASTKFWELEKRIRRDQQSPGVVVEMRRSKLLSNLIGLLDGGVIATEDLNGFSEGLRERVAWIERSRKLL